MCWGLTSTVAMIGIGGLATTISVRRRDPAAIPLTLGYFTVMEGLQLAGYLVIDQCGTPTNEAVTHLSTLHIVFQPFIINAFALELVPLPIRSRARIPVFFAAALCTIVMLLQLYPFGWAGSCAPGSILCAERLCTVSGDWHIAWEVPYNGLLNGIDRSLGLAWGFQSYVIAIFVLPLFYGAWRFVLFNVLVGPVLSAQLTRNPNEYPAIWCLFSIGVVLIALSPAVRRQVAWRAAPM